MVRPMLLGLRSVLGGEGGVSITENVPEPQGSIYCALIGAPSSFILRRLSPSRTKEPPQVRCASVFREGFKYAGRQMF